MSKIEITGQHSDSFIIASLEKRIDGLEKVLKTSQRSITDLHNKIATLSDALHEAAKSESKEGEEAEYWYKEYLKIFWDE